jgi:hypothetical protein
MFEYHRPNPSWLDRLERRLGFLAIPRLPIYILGGQALFTAFGLSDPNIGQRLCFHPLLAAQGEWWRFFTFLMIPDTSPMGLAFAFFWFSFFWFVCQSLEAQWGAFRCSLYILLGWLGQLGVSWLAWVLWRLPVVLDGRELFLSLQLAFAWYFPEYVIYIYFILPIRMRTMAWLTGAYLLYGAVTGWPSQTLVVAGSLINYILFFAADHARNLQAMRQSGASKAEFSRKLGSAKSAARPMTCVSCGKDPNQADIRLCTCERCGEDGKFWCTEELKEHLKA